MVSYKVSPYVHFIESHLVPNAVQYGVFHQFTGEVLQPDNKLRTWLAEAKLRNQVLGTKDLKKIAGDQQMSSLISEEFLAPGGYDFLASFADHYVTRPIQNPAVAYQSETGVWYLVRISMLERVYSPKPYNLPPIIEEAMSPLIAEVFLAADGIKTLGEIFTSACHNSSGTVDHHSFQAAIEFLTDPERQLIKLTRNRTSLANPYLPFNTVPRNFYHSSRWQGGEGNSDSIKDFHREGIEDASWEFDIIEPTMNHALRFPNEVSGGFDYGSRFCLSVLKPEILSPLDTREALRVLEVGGGTGTFALSFIEQAQRSTTLKYHILELSPALIESQTRILSGVQPKVHHFEQDATEFDLSGQRFHLIIANEVVADFPTAEVHRGQPNEINRHGQAHDETRFVGEGAQYVDRYELRVDDAPDRFLVNAGMFQFIEQAWKHLLPGGTLILSEYGSVSAFPVRSFHLNHAEFSIHFGHALQCGQKLGFNCRLYTLKEFLSLDDSVPVLSGREEHIRCLNHVLEQHGMSLPFAIISERKFNEHFQSLVQRIQLTGFSFSPLSNNFYYGPNINDFMVLSMNKPLDK